MVLGTKNTDNRYGQQVFRVIYGHFAVLDFVRTGHGQSFQKNGQVGTLALNNEKN
jgi:hypothetical protein